MNRPIGVNIQAIEHASRECLAQFVVFPRVACHSIQDISTEFGIVQRKEDKWVNPRVARDDNRVMEGWMVDGLQIYMKAIGQTGVVLMQFQLARQKVEQVA